MLKWKCPLEVFPVIMYARLSLKPRGGTFKSSEPETDTEPCLEMRTILQQTIAHITLRGTSWQPYHLRNIIDLLHECKFTMQRPLTTNIQRCPSFGYIIVSTPSKGFPLSYISYSHSLCLNILLKVPNI